MFIRRKKALSYELKITKAPSMQHPLIPGPMLPIFIHFSR